MTRTKKASHFFDLGQKKINRMNKKQNPRLKNIVIRVNDKEHNQIENQANKLGLTISDYGRQLMLQGSVISVQKKDNQQEGTGMDRRTLIGIANNLNQLTRYAHEKRDLPHIEELLKALYKLLK